MKLTFETEPREPGTHRRVRDAPGRLARAVHHLAGIKVQPRRELGAVALTAAGLAMLTSAALVIAVPFGLAVGGVALFVLEWRIS